MLLSLTLKGLQDVLETLISGGGHRWRLYPDVGRGEGVGRGVHPSSVSTRLFLYHPLSYHPLYVTPSFSHHMASFAHPHPPVNTSPSGPSFSSTLHVSVPVCVPVCVTLPLSVSLCHTVYMSVSVSVRPSVCVPVSVTLSP